MNTRNLIVALAAVAAVTFGAYQLGVNRGQQNAAPAGGTTRPAAAGSPASLKAGDIDPSNGRRILYWHDPMAPQQKFDKAGKSPFMDMPLQPVYADGAEEGTVSISPRVEHNLGVRTTEVVRASLAPKVETVGSVAYNERDLVMVQARSNGFLEKLYVRAPLDPVRQGQPLAQLYVPDWVAAQEDYLSAKRIAAQTEVSGLATLVDGARQRMRLAGMTDEQIAAVEKGGKVQARITITAPIGGVIAELGAREGMTVMPGAPLFKINGLGTVWVNAEVPESMASQVRPGSAVDVRTAAFPGTTFKGRVSAILPEVNMATRTLKARIEVANPGAKLVPGMFATVDLSPAAHREVLAVPSEAVIQTGKRSVVMLAQGEGKFAPVEVETGIDANGQTEIRKGLEPGQKVVVSGQFLIDSEANLKATATRMTDTAVAAAPQTHRAVGVVEQVARDEITISHEAIASLKWPAMTMSFALATEVPAKLAAGDKVAFELREKKDGTFEVAKLEPLGENRAHTGHAMAKGPGR